MSRAKQVCILQRIVIFASMLGICFSSFPSGHSSPLSPQVTLNCTTSVQAGFTTLCTGELAVIDNTPLTIWPTLNGSQWCAQMTFQHLSNASKLEHFSFRCPIPNPGFHNLRLEVTGANDYKVPFPVGREIPTNLVVAYSNDVVINVSNRIIKPPPKAMGGLLGIEWEPWFTLHNNQWNLAEAVPILGFYDSYNADVIKQHAIWMIDAGMDYIMIDWTNNLWNIEHWAQRGVYAQELINATTAIFETYAKMRSSNLSTPDIVLLLGLDNGPSEPIECLQEEIDWVTNNYLANYSNLFLEFDGKPLLVVFDGGGVYSPTKRPLSVNQWTLRMMASQLQNTPQLVDRGYWSWMDGVLNPIPVHQPTTNQTEVVTVTCAFFSSGGWLAPSAKGKRQGATLVEEVAYAIQHNPDTLLLNQWNEFAGQEQNSTSIYVDIFNATLGNDMEPTSYTECAYQRPNNRRCGGWGFRYLNLIRALRFIYTGIDTKSTILTVAQPLNHTFFPLNSMISVTWASVGAGPCKASIYVDDHFVGSYGPNITMAKVSTASFSPGPHSIKVVMPVCTTHFPLSLFNVDAESPFYSAPPTVTIIVHLFQPEL